MPNEDDINRFYSYLDAAFDYASDHDICCRTCSNRDKEYKSYCQFENSISDSYICEHYAVNKNMTGEYNE